MPAIHERGEGNARRRDRLAKLKRGPGVFVYDGEAYDTEATPTPLLTGMKSPVFNAAGLPVMDQSGRQIYERSGRPVIAQDGTVVMGGVPKVKRIKIKVLALRGVEFPEGKSVLVTDESLALKLRGMDVFEEVLGKDAEKLLAEAPKKKRGRPPGRQSAADAEDAADAARAASIEASGKSANERKAAARAARLAEAEKPTAV